jgi:transposase
MLCEERPARRTPFDDEVFGRFVPADHVLRRAAEGLDWQRFRPLLASAYSPDLGRPSLEPVRLLKLEFLRYKYGLSDGAVVERARTDMAFRYFLGMNARDLPPDASTLSVFRGRLGVEGFHRVFHELVALGRAQGIVKDRLRLKDATHVIANMAVPSALMLVAQARDKLLTAAQPFAAELVAGERINVQLLHERTVDQQPEARLQCRVDQLCDILAWADRLPIPEIAEHEPAWSEFVAARQLAHKILFDYEHPEKGDCTRSVVDSDARRSKHGDWFDGYMLDVLMDADSELITSVNVLPGNGDEAWDALALVQDEEAAHGNKVAALSMDGAGYHGPLLDQLQDPAGLALDVYVPPRQEPRSEYFSSPDFTYDSEQQQVTCPAGQCSRYCERDKKGKGWIFRFARGTCHACPLLSHCMKTPPKHFGKVVHKSEHVEVLQRVHAKARTEAYAAVRKEHPRVERKLSDLVHHYGARRARYRGLAKVLYQATMACFTANVSRLLRLQCAPTATTSSV